MQDLYDREFPADMGKESFCSRWYDTALLAVVADNDDMTTLLKESSHNWFLHA